MIIIYGNNLIYKGICVSSMRFEVSYFHEYSSLVVFMYIDWKQLIIFLAWEKTRSVEIKRFIDMYLSKYSCMLWHWVYFEYYPLCTQPILNNNFKLLYYHDTMEMNNFLKWFNVYCFSKFYKTNQIEEVSIYEISLLHACFRLYDSIYSNELITTS